jgi:hypothetical protein
MAALETAATAIAGGGLTWLGNGLFQWFKSRGDRDVQLEEHRDGLTFDLLKAAREDIATLRLQVADYGELTVKAAHIEEALDHIYALLHAEGDAEANAARRRATAFLKRMRPDPAEQRGEERNAVQREISAAQIIKDAKGDRP